jgi:hypothetical protein
MWSVLFRLPNQNFVCIISSPVGPLTVFSSW